MFNRNPEPSPPSPTEFFAYIWSLEGVRVRTSTSASTLLTTDTRRVNFDLRPTTYKSSILLLPLCPFGFSHVCLLFLRLTIIDQIFRPDVLTHTFQTASRIWVPVSISAEGIENNDVRFFRTPLVPL